MCVAPGGPRQHTPAIPGQEVGIGECVSVLLILIKSGKFLRVVTAEQLHGCAGKTAFWGRVATIKVFESTVITSALSKIL